jgi:hypothetical protein
VFINRFPLASPSETRECPEKESISSTDKRTTHEEEEERDTKEKEDGERWRINAWHDSQQTQDGER